jgi:2-oxoglutarate dehydrogenase E2 component (dihydrolipoamide succinyltransferase)
MADVEMPQLGETVTEGTITKWFKAVGDQVAADEVLFEVSTDKVDSEVPSPAGGVLTEILVPEGETVDVGTKLAIIGDAAGAGAPAPAEAAPAAEPVAEPEPEPQAEAPAAAAPPPPPPPPPPPAAAAPAAPAAAPAAGAPAGSANGSGGGLLLSPVVRKLINEHGLDPASITGTGAGGRITRSDVLAAAESRSGSATSPAPAAAKAPAAPAPPAAAPAAAKAPAARQPAPEVHAGQHDTAEPFNNIRRRTAEHMVMSKAVSAHALIATEVDFEGVERVRRAHGEAFKADEGFTLTYLPFIALAVVDALREFPHVNASVGDGELILHHDINLGIAVDLDFSGLIVPVIHGADGKRLRAIAREVSDLAGRARNRQLSADDISGGTFTITNPGPFGTFITGAIINQPQVAVLSTDGIKRRPVVVEGPDGGEAIAIHSVGMLVITWDHRAFDGAYAAAFVRRVQEIIETRDWAAELG